MKNLTWILIFLFGFYIFMECGVLKILSITKCSNRRMILHSVERMREMVIDWVVREHFGWFMNYYSSLEKVDLIDGVLLMLLLMTALILIQIKKTIHNQ